MIFRKAKMLARLESEGRAHLIDDESKKLMDNLDGKEVFKSRYAALVLDKEEYLVSYQGKNYPVNKLDCDS